ncbi:hypothetical protein ACFLT9_07115 [Acidobacteriota bacterium]
MITMIRIKSQADKNRICETILQKKDQLQSSFGGKGQLLYLSKRHKHDDVSLIVHTVDPDALGEFISENLNQMEQITDMWVINLIKPVFYPLPKDTRNFERFTVTLKVHTKNLNEVYSRLASAELPDGLKMAYIAFTFHLFGDSIQLSLLAEREELLNSFLSGVVNKLPGVLNTKVNRIEGTRPLVSYDEWKVYSSKYGIVPSWDEELMVGQFRT